MNHSRDSRRRTYGRPTAKGPEPIGNVLSDLMARKGYANIQSGNAHQETWQSVAGPFSSQSRAGNIKRGVLEVVVPSSTVLQEITFQKAALLQSFSEFHPELQITDIRFRVGSIT